MKRVIGSTILLGISLLALACGGGDKESGSGAQRLQLGALTIEDHGTKDVSNATTLELEADSFYYEPTFLRGKAGEKLKLTVDNESDTTHNFTLASLQIDQDIPSKGKTQVEVTFPSSGA